MPETTLGFLSPGSLRFGAAPLRLTNQDSFVAVPELSAIGGDHRT